MSDDMATQRAVCALSKLDEILDNFPKPHGVSWHDYLMEVDQLEERGLGNDTGFLLGFLAGTDMTLDQALALYDPKRLARGANQLAGGDTDERQ